MPKKYDFPPATCLLPDQTEMPTKQPNLLQKSSNLSSPWTSPPKFLFYNPHHLAYVFSLLLETQRREESKQYFVYIY